MFDTSTLKRSNKFSAERHGFHLVRPSPWPIVTSAMIFTIALYSLKIFHGFEYSKARLVFYVVLFLYGIGMWFRDIVIEATMQGHHTSVVQRGLRYGMVVFLISESMFFFGFFWCFFYMSIAPSIWIGCTWPPEGITPVDPYSIPLLNTILLISSGVTAVFAHKSMTYRFGRYNVFRGLGLSIAYGIAFTCFQMWEYKTAGFSINDSIYGSIFYVSTGFHGLHVIIGTVALIVCFIRHYYYHFTMEHHIGFECSLWYWHFVDVIWILLYIFVYIWGNRY
jgi:heme/copper-type cytochrome/quinol oxidase subunit 3